MRQTVLEPQAKEALRKTVRGLREQLLSQIADAAKGEYRLDIPLAKAKLPEARRCRRERLEAWLDEQERSGTPRARAFDQAVKEAAHTLLNRLVFLRILEHHGVVSPPVVTGGWSSPAYEQEFSHYAGPLMGDPTRGYQALLGVVFAELALELPGLFGPVGLTPLFPIPAGTLREVVEALDDDVLAGAWGDDTTLGWVYQYWNDPEREALDAKIGRREKIEPHEIASKTQMFTERYMVEWLLQNSLGLTWQRICRKNGWIADVERVLPVLDERRAGWRKKRDAGVVALDALMPVEPGLESAWKYYVPQPIPEDAVANAPDTVRELRLLDPACGSGHFLVIAFDLLVCMYQEEARHRGETWTDAEIAESILTNNLHGIDIDPRAIQIAAAGLWLKANLQAPGAKVRRMNLVAPALRLATLPDDDPALVELRTDLKREVNLPEETTQRLVSSLAGVDYLGSLLKVDAAAEAALGDATLLIERGKQGQGDLFRGFPMQQVELSLGEAKATVLDAMESFLARHSTSEDLGLRLHGEQLASGVRFVRMTREGTYDVVVGNPPYQALTKTVRFEYVVKHYARGKADLYAAFLERGIELTRDGGISSLLTMRGWMFLNQFRHLREWTLSSFDLRSIGDFAVGAFDEVPNDLLTVAIATFCKGRPSGVASVATQPSPPEDTSYDRQRTSRKRAAVLAQVGRYEFDPQGFKVIEGEPIVYWWTKESLERYAAAPKLGDVSPARFGLNTGNNIRFLRKAWELKRAGRLSWAAARAGQFLSELKWSPFLKGAAGTAWMDSCEDTIRWSSNGLEVKMLAERLYGSYSRQIRNERVYWQPGVAFTMIGNSFASRAHRRPCVIGDKGSSVYPDGVAECLCVMNRAAARAVLASLNPSISFQVGDVNRLPVFPVRSACGVFEAIEGAFTDHESHREPSVEFRGPGPSPWRHAQEWAQRAVDRAEGEPLPPYEPELDPPPAESHVSFAIGVALGRFGADGEGILEAALMDSLPGGILFVGASEHLSDSLQQATCRRIESAWETHHAENLSSNKPQSLRDWLRKDFFVYHKALYENRPIYFPLSSEKRSFVAYVNIHRWVDNTLQTLLADHLYPTLRQLDGEIEDLNQARTSSDKKKASAAEKQYASTKKLRDELADFIAAVAQCAERGAPPTGPDCPPREADATFRMDLDDGVMINSAALWPLLGPQWKDPKKWWKQLCRAAKDKDYDWAHLARRYFPDRVEEKCKDDASMAVAHGCFWKYHPAKAYAWELRLQHEIRPDFTIDEADSNDCRARFLREHAADAGSLRAKEEQRRARAEKKKAENGDGKEGNS